jgi:hypothetical protein
VKKINIDLDRLSNWNALKIKLNEKFDQDLELEGILFLVGVQELGKGYQKFSKDEKLNVMHIAICTLLEPYGFYAFLGRDEDGWPHWNRNEKLPPLKPMQQEFLIKDALLEYFKELVS